MTIEKQVEGFEKKPIRSLFKWAIILCLLGGVFTAWHYARMPAKMAIERQVMKQSFQYKEGMAQRAAILEANIIEVENQLRMDPTNQGLEGQLRTLKAQHRATLINQ